MDFVESLRILHEVEEQFQTSFLTTEGKLLLLIKSQPGNNVKYYMNQSGLSYRGYYNIIRKLRERSLVQMSTSEIDSRARCIS